MSETLPQRADQSLARPAWFEWAMEHPGRSHCIEANGSRLHLLSWNDEARDKPALLFVHGFRGHAHWWDFIAPFFAQQYRVIAMDLSGMGDSARRTSYGPQTMANDVVAVAEWLQAPELIAIGHSYGGSRVLRACADRPELFNRLIIIDSYVVFSDQEALREPAKIRGDREYPDVEAAIARFRLLPHQADAIPCLVEHVARHSVRKTATGVRWKFDVNLPAGGARECDGEQLLRSIERPVDYLVGERSVVVNPVLARRVASYLKDVRGPITIPYGHHHLMFDQPIALISTLRALLA
ncbi:MAG TPA: alpha/beta hydrolase [Pseudomonas sp.]|jgi:pimeloyl-ACP methyl ester carboxylesterase